MEAPRNNTECRTNGEPSMLSPWEKLEIYWVTQRLSEQQWNLDDEVQYALFVSDILENMNLPLHQQQRLHDSLKLELIKAKITLSVPAVRNWCFRMVLKVLQSEHFYPEYKEPDPRADRIRHISNLRMILGESIRGTIEQNGLSSS